MNINGYKLKGELKNANSGFSKWGFATKNGKEYFIKELINPVYPIDKSIMSEELFEQRRVYCSHYETKFKKFFGLINEASYGNLVRIADFFRCGSRYYLITEKVEGESPSMEYISSLDDEKKLLLLKTVSHCFYNLHSVGIVHADIKPDNILIKKTKNGNYAAKLIDFDSVFLKGDVLNNKELGGELTYLAPETFLGIYGENIQLDEKSDIFGLGLLFHQYYCGFLPYYDEKEYEYPYEAVLDGSSLVLDKTRIPEKIGKLISSMLDVMPQRRPSAEDVIKTLNDITGQSEKSLAVRQIILHFGGAFGKSISISVDAIKYRNTVHLSVQDEMEQQKEYYPDDYLEQKMYPIEHKKIYDEIIGKVVDAGVWDLVFPSDKHTFDSNKICQAIGVITEGGDVFSYSTEENPDSKFENIVSILSSYCTFPEKHGCVLRWGGDVIESEDIENRNDDWFRPAGDL